MAAPWDALSMAVLSNVNILPLQKRVTKLKAKMVFKAFNGLLRSYIAEYRFKDSVQSIPRKQETEREI